MTQAPVKIAKAAWHVLPAGARRRLHYTTTGVRFLRFVVVSAAALVTGQVSLALLISGAHVSAGASGVAASMIAAAVSYVLSRWAWERKGRPDVLRETLPFWAVSVGAWGVLGLTSHYASVWATSMNLHGWRHQGVINGLYFAANCVTFLTRFAIFHYVLFVDRGARRPAPSSLSP